MLTGLQKDHNLRVRSCLLAFDLKKRGLGIMLKGYVNFFRKATILEMSPLVMICEAVRRLDGRKDEKAALDKLEEFVTRRDGGYEGISIPVLTIMVYIIVIIVKRPFKFTFSL